MDVGDMAQKNVVAPKMPAAIGNVYDPALINQLTNVLRLYFNQLDNAGPITASTQRNGTDVIAGLSFFPTGTSTTPSLPTQADLANLRVGDIYYDTTASNVLKVKT
jgi:hypothetical protein